MGRPTGTWGYERSRRERSGRKESAVQEPRGREPDWRRLLDATSDGLAGVEDGVLVWANAALARLAGLSRADDLVGTSLAELLRAPDGAVAAVLAGLGAAPLRCRLARPDGVERPVVVELVDPGAADAAPVVCVRDVGELLTLEAEVLRTGRALHDARRELAALRERLRSESAEREELLTVVSHELRTPCTVIQGYNRLLLSGRFGELSERQRRFLEESQKSCQRLNAFIGNLVETARQSLSVGPLEVAEAPLAPLVEGVVRHLAPLLEEQRLRVELDLHRDAPRVRCDPPRVEQVLVNLIGNALKFAPIGSAVEIASRTVEQGGRRMVEIAVLDAGPGVDPRDAERIFEPYVQAGERRKAGGLGLGLAICRRIVEAHGGRIGVEPRPGGGARFAFTLPAAGPERLDRTAAGAGPAAW
jgi:signal transduction histidine kinase